MGDLLSCSRNLTSYWNWQLFSWSLTCKTFLDSMCCTEPSSVVRAAQWRPQGSILTSFAEAKHTRVATRAFGGGGANAAGHVDVGKRTLCRWSVCPPWRHKQHVLWSLQGTQEMRDDRK